MQNHLHFTHISENLTMAYFANMHIDILHYQDANSRGIALLASFIFLLLLIHSRPMIITATSTANRNRRATVTPATTGAANSPGLIIIGVLVGVLVTVTVVGGSELAGAA